MSKFDPSVYKSILSVKPARVFDAAGFCMRFYGYMMNIGTVTMLSLAGYSFLTAGFVSSVIALVVFVVSPRIGKIVDSRGQHKVVPIAAAITLTGLAAMLVTVQAHGPDWLLYICAIPMGFIPSAQALTRARWTYLIRTGRLGASAPDLHTVFSYEGVIDDIAFMIGPAASIALAAGITPIVGLLVGGILLAFGATVMTFARSTEPVPGWSAEEESMPTEDERALVGDGADGSDNSAAVEASATASPMAAHRKSVIRTIPAVRVLFALMLFLGGFYGIFDTTSVAFAEQIGDPNVASVALMISGLISVVVGFVFGMVRIRVAPYKQVLLFACIIGFVYGSMMLIFDVPTFYIVSIVGAFCYAPFLITLNSVCERTVPGKQLTEAITWLNAGCTCGLAIGPSVAGIVIDLWGSLVGFDIGGIVALFVPITAIAFLGVLHRGIRT